MDDDPALPRRVIVLGEAMRPLRRKIGAQLDQPVLSATWVFDIVEIVHRHIDGLSVLIDRIADRINRLMPDVVSNENATDGDVYRAVGGVEAFVDELLAGYRDARALGVCGRDAEGRDLLAGAYRHTLVEIKDWLDELIEALADPVAARRRRGLPLTGHVEIPVVLTLTAARELTALSRWLKDVGEACSSADVPERKSPIRFWRRVGYLILAWVVGAALFGGNG